MMFIQTLSRFYEGHALRFICISGLFLLYANAYLNLCTMAKRRYDYFYVEPYVYFGLVLLDYAKVLTDQQAAIVYVAFSTWIMVKYLLFMYGLVDQITDFLNIRFLHNKPVSKI